MSRMFWLAVFLATLSLMLLNAWAESLTGLERGWLGWIGFAIFYSVFGIRALAAMWGHYEKPGACGLAGKP